MRCAVSPPHLKPKDLDLDDIWVIDPPDRNSDSWLPSIGWWLDSDGSAARRLEAWQAQLLLAAGDTSRVRAAPI
jgi:hypothetical protein